MRTIRIHVDQPLAVGREFSLPAQASEHVGHVLRMVAGDAVVVFNGDGADYQATIRSVGKREVVVTVDSSAVLNNESPLQLTLAQGVARGEKMDLIIQKATELGISRIVPLQTERSEVRRLDPARAEKRLAHWRAVVASACEQSGRARVPEVCPAQPLQSWLASLSTADGTRLALLPEGTRRIRQLQLVETRGVLVVGPEGGLGERDTALLAGHGFEGLQLGPRILRTETAGLAAIAALQAVYGDA
jgi:16S rRNA (uracil1498-N3)-methyltransferase